MPPVLASIAKEVLSFWRSWLQNLHSCLQVGLLVRKLSPHSLQAALGGQGRRALPHSHVGNTTTWPPPCFGSKEASLGEAAPDFGEIGSPDEQRLGLGCWKPSSCFPRAHPSRCAVAPADTQMQPRNNRDPFTSESNPGAWDLQRALSSVRLQFRLLAGTTEASLPEPAPLQTWHPQKWRSCSSLQIPFASHLGGSAPRWRLQAASSGP